ncbi:MAG: ImmA/IrrE family metallo-endopeptidase [Methylothermaceae bacterium]|nr:ImmA/IrrE family metallo-endopeptidase [Methylothermaceae bacterium]
MTRVAVRPEILKWARERARLGIDDLAKKFPEIVDWESGDRLPTYKQLEDFANATHVPFGYLFLPEPPDIPMPIPDFRTIRNRQVGTISPDLLDTIYTMQRRQAWLREERLEGDAEPLAFVGSANLADDPAAVGREMRRLTGLGDGWATGVRTWQEAVNVLRQVIEELGVMAVINGIVGNNTRRKLDVEEFRGFALSDEYAPLIFVNGADAKSAQMFTLAHELAHIWLGAPGSGLSGFPGIFPEGGDVEMFCDRAAAEFLVPEAELRAQWPEVRREASPFEVLARRFKVSPIVTGRRAMDLRLVERQTFFDFYEGYTQQERSRKQAIGGRGDFYNNQNTRVGKLFATRVIRAAKEGRIGFKQAYDLTGLNGGTFQEYAHRLGIELPSGQSHEALSY